MKFTLAIVSVILFVTAASAMPYGNETTAEPDILEIIEKKVKDLEESNNKLKENDELIRYATGILIKNQFKLKNDLQELTDELHDDIEYLQMEIERDLDPKQTRVQEITVVISAPDAGAMSDSPKGLLHRLMCIAKKAFKRGA